MQLMFCIFRALSEAVMSYLVGTSLPNSLVLDAGLIAHYRFILGDIGRDITSFTTTKELVETLTGGLQGTRNDSFLFPFAYPSSSY